MKQINDILTVWGDVGYTFGLMPIWINTSDPIDIEIFAGGGSVVITRPSFARHTVDIAPIVAVLMPYSMPFAGAGMCSTVEIEVRSGSTVLSPRKAWSAPIVFGSEPQPPTRHVMYYNNFPCSIDIVANNPIRVANYKNDISQLSSYAKIARGGEYMTTFELSSYAGGDKLRVISVSDDASSQDVLAAKEVVVSVSDCTEGLYLRWLGDTGEVFYYLFKVLSSGKETEIAGSYDAIPNYSANLASPYVGGVTTTSYNIIESKSVGAYLDREMFYTVSTIIGSPLVEYFDGEKFSRVSIGGASVSDSGKSYQEFAFNVTMPTRKTQRL